MNKLREIVDKVIPMTFGSLLMFLFVIYLLIIVGKTVATNYKSNKDIESQAVKLIDLESQIHQLQNEINYFQTSSYKEKEARAKLGYKLSGETVLSMPIDTDEEKVPDSSLLEAKVREPNYRLWWRYFFGE
ncbi:MAG: septum formation initiator family protein [Patescibacteria group bacterium]